MNERAGVLYRIHQVHDAREYEYGSQDGYRDLPRDDLHLRLGAHIDFSEHHKVRLGVHGAELPRRPAAEARGLPLCRACCPGFWSLR